MSPSSPSPRWIGGPGRLTGIDGLRAIACLAVAVTHFRSWFGGEYPVGPLAPAVDLFFFHSGMVLARAYGGGIVSGTFSFKDFAWRRFLRLYPLYFAVLALSCVLEVREAGGLPSGTLWSWFLQATWLNNTGIDPRGVWNFPMWALSVEWILSLLFFEVVHFLRDGAPRGWAALAGISALFLFPLAFTRGHDTWRDFQWTNWGFLSLGLVRGVFDFSLGAAGYAWLEKLPRPRVPVLNGIEIGCLLYLLAMGWFWELPIAHGSDLLAVAVVLPLLSAACMVPGSALNRLLTLPALVLLGDMSYSLYLVHLPIGKLLGEALEGHLGAPWIGALFLAVLIGAAYALYRWVDVPARQFAMRVTSPKQAPAAVPPKKAA